MPAWLRVCLWPKADSNDRPIYLRDESPPSISVGLERKSHSLACYCGRGQAMY